MDTKESLSKKAKAQPRDENGHFVKKGSNPISRFRHNETAVHESTDDDELIDIHIGNPLRKITELLEQIKKQKAFSFTLKGSLGIMGVVLVTGTFGILGSSKLLCDKGAQTKMGLIRQLAYKEYSEKTFLDYVPFIESILPDRRIYRKVLLLPDNRIIHLIFRNDTTPPQSTYSESTPSFLTGSYDSCSEALTIDQTTGIELSSK